MQAKDLAHNKSSVRAVIIIVAILIVFPQHATVVVRLRGLPGKHVFAHEEVLSPVLFSTSYS